MGCHSSKTRQHHNSSTPDFDDTMKPNPMNKPRQSSLEPTEELTHCQTAASQSQNTKPSIPQIYENLPINYTLSEGGLQSNKGYKRTKKYHSEDLTTEFFERNVDRDQIRERFYTQSNLKNANVIEVKVIFNNNKNKVDINNETQNKSFQAQKKVSRVKKSRNQYIREHVKSLEAMNQEARTELVNKRQVRRMEEFKLQDAELSSIKRRRKQTQN